MNFAESRILKLVESFSGHCLAIKELKLMAQNQLQVLHYPDANFITFQSSGMRRKHNFAFSLPHFFRFSSLTFCYAGNLLEDG